MGSPYRMHYNEEDDEGNKANSTGDTYKDAADAVREGVEYVKYVSEEDPKVKVTLDIETIEDRNNK